MKKPNYFENIESQLTDDLYKAKHRLKLCYDRWFDTGNVTFDEMRYLPKPQYLLSEITAYNNCRLNVNKRVKPHGKAFRKKWLQYRRKQLEHLNEKLLKAGMSLQKTLEI